MRASVAAQQTARMSRSRSVAALVVLGLFAAACTGVEPGPAETASGDEPRYGGTLVVATPADPGALNPAITTSGLTHPVTGQIFNGLIRLDRAFTPQPDLAKSWEVSEDKRTYTFRLQENVTWHDGEPFSSADVKFSFEQILVKFSQRTQAALAPILDSIEAPDKNTVVFKLKQPYAPLVELLDEDNGAILPKHLYEGTDPLTNPANAKPVGTGPFKFESSLPGDRITLVRNADYFQPNQPYLDRMIFRVIPSPPQALQALQAGEVNLILFPIPPLVDQLRKLPETVVTEEGREGFARVIRLIPNLRRKPFDDVRVRRAMASAIDREFIAKTVYAGQFQPATGPITRGLTWAYTDDVKDYPRDLEKARALLDEAGLPPGADGVRFRASFIYDQSFAPVADLLKQQLGEVGIALDLQLMDFGSWVKKLYIDWDFDLGYSQLTDAPDPDFGAKSVFTCASIVKVPFVNGGGYCNPRVDELFARAAATTNRQERVELYHDVQRIIVNEQPQIFLVDGVGPWAYSTQFRGFEDAGAKAPYYFGSTVWDTTGTVSPPGNPDAPKPGTSPTRSP
jgi:peptide/nickel transport system substrate-binding protein